MQVTGAQVSWRAVGSGRSLRIGTEVRVIVTAVNPIEGLIDLDLVPEGGVDNAAPKGGHGTRDAKDTRGAKGARSTRDAKAGRGERRGGR